MPKSKDAFRTISEVADWLETPAHVLRFWESKFTQVKPVKRAGGRRYYRPADMQLLGGIKKLLHDDGLTIKGAQKLLREHGVKHVVALSQPLDDDLIDDDVTAEAAYEPDAQPEPANETPATVLSFPSRSAPETTPEVAQTPEPEPTPAPVSENAANVATTDEAATTPIEAPATPEPATPPPTDDSPAFGSDALPAFLRRAPAQATSDAPKVTAPDEDVSETPLVAETSTATSSEAETPKLTIDPIARFEPVETEAEVEEAPVETVETAKSDPSPTFAPRARDETATPVPAPADVTQDVQPAPPPEPVAPAKPIAVDVPSIAKVAPALDSFEGPAGLLSALPGTRKLSPEVTDQLSKHLAELRGLRDRMRNH